MERRLRELKDKQDEIQDNINRSDEKMQEIDRERDQV